MTSKNRARPSDPLGRYYTPDECAWACVLAVGEHLRHASWALEPGAGGGAFVRALVRYRREHGLSFRILAMDVDPTCSARGSLEASAGDRWATGDFLSARAWPATWPAQVDVIVGNPPYSVDVPVLHATGPKKGKQKRYPPSKRGGDGVWETHPKAGQLVVKSVEVAADHCLRALELLQPEGVCGFVLRDAFSGSQKRWAKLWRQDVLKRRDTLIPRPGFLGGGTDSAEYDLYQLGPPGQPEARCGWLLWERT